MTLLFARIAPGQSRAQVRTAAERVAMVWACEACGVEPVTA
jgi:hypothetical protein